MVMIGAITSSTNSYRKTPKEASPRGSASIYQSGSAVWSIEFHDGGQFASQKITRMWCPGPELNRYVLLRTRDFKPSGSARKYL
jgi:hypothetical protein